jgi:flagella basal body P-ring formation protein FlgA
MAMVGILRRSIICVLILAAAGFCFGLGVSAELEKPVIQLLTNTVVTGADVFLDDIAEFDSEELKAHLGKIYIGAAPLPGSTRRFTLGQIEVRLRQVKLDPRDFHFTGAKEVLVTAQAPVQPAPAPALSSQTGLPGSPAPASAASVPSAGQDTLIYHVVVPVRNIARHEVISLEDLKIEERTGRTVPSNLAAIEDLVGKRATRLLAAGTALTTSAAEPVPLVEVGDLVTMVVTSGPVTVTATGKVLQKGALGDIVAVENVSTRAKVYGVVLNSDLVKIEIGGLK